MRYSPRKKAALAAAASSAFLLLPATAFAVSIVPECARGSELAQLPCMLETLGNIAQLILGVTGGLALLMFVYGGFLILSSGGSQDKVKKGKDILVSAVIGIFIILLAGYLIRYGLARLGVGDEYLETPAPAEEAEGEESETESGGEEEG
ncbi:MAG: pilin [Patescibacteria group bacterium]|nr:pilin [Patescibacteria group bacterium]